MLFGVRRLIKYATFGLISFYIVYHILRYGQIPFGGFLSSFLGVTIGSAGAGALILLLWCL